jgi:PBSX family phage terminase large subunit
MRKLSGYMGFTEKQKYALQFIGKGFNVFYGGARGGGKTHFSLETAVLCSIKYPKLKTVAIRETYPELEEAFIANLKDKYPEKVFQYNYVEKTKTATFSNGSKILFRACDNEESARKIRGLEFQFMIIDEANNLDWATIERLKGSLRRTKELVGFIPTLLMTGNPGGRSDMYFKTRFINPDYKRWDANELKFKERYIFIPANVYDNPYIGEEYVETLESLSDDLRRAWLDGDWNVYEGQFFIEWEPKQHVVGHFDIPDDWERKAAIDLGYTKRHPTVALFAAQDPVSKTVYIYREYVGDGVPVQYARDINALMRNENITAFFADPSMFGNTSKTYTADTTTAQIFLNEGIYLQPANNSRVDGWRVMKQWLHWTTRQRPLLRVFETCRYFIESIPTLTYDKSRQAMGEDLNTRQADDAVDAGRYLLISGYGYPTRTDIVLSEKEDKRKQAFEERFTEESIYKRILNTSGDDGSIEEYEPLRRMTYHEDTFVSTRSYYG